MAVDESLMASLGIPAVEPGEKTFPVVEVFGPTIQGEGALAGSVSHFIRFGGCDYGCFWCDSAPAVRPELVREAGKLSAKQILACVELLRPAEWVTISGGNPALHDLTDLVRGLKGRGFKVAVETQGSKWKLWLGDVDQLTISPKPPSSGMVVLGRATLDPDLESYIEAWHLKYTQTVNFKVPIFDRVDFEWARDLHAAWMARVPGAWPGIPFFLSVVTRMGGLRGDFAGGAIDTTQDILDRYKQVIDWTLADPAMADVRVIPQLHALVWGHERGH